MWAPKVDQWIVVGAGLYPIRKARPWLFSSRSMQVMTSSVLLGDGSAANWEWLWLYLQFAPWSVKRRMIEWEKRSVEAREHEASLVEGVVGIDRHTHIGHHP